MPLPFELNVSVPDLFNGTPHVLTITGGLMTFVGPNGAGKTQMLHAFPLCEEPSHHQSDEVEGAGREIRC